MRVFLDTNLLLATILDDAERADESTRFLDRDDLEFVNSSVNVMELGRADEEARARTRRRPQIFTAE